MRPRHAARLLGTNDRLDGMRVLELGPLEGAHTYQLEKLGAASILAIEANADAFLKCLITKEILSLGAAKFVYGDFCEYLKETNEEFDLVFCCGVLYHMSDPIALIESIAKVTTNVLFGRTIMTPRIIREQHEKFIPTRVTLASSFTLRSMTDDGGRFLGRQSCRIRAA